LRREKEKLREAVAIAGLQQQVDADARAKAAVENANLQSKNSDLLKVIEELRKSRSPVSSPVEAELRRQIDELERQHREDQAEKARAERDKADLLGERANQQKRVTALVKEKSDLEKEDADLRDLLSKSPEPAAGSATSNARRFAFVVELGSIRISTRGINRRRPLTMPTLSRTSCGQLTSK
jgi:hypothetical protein